MSQPPNSSERPGASQPSMTALKEYHSLMAAGHFKPASSITLPTPVLRASTPQPPPPQASPAPPVGMYASPRSTPSPSTHASSLYASSSTMAQLASARHPPNSMAHQTYRPFPGAPPSQQPPIYTPNSSTREVISARIQDILRDKLPEFSPPNNVMLSTQLTNRIIHLGVNRRLGPDGLSGVHDIFMVIGYEGRGRYMGLAVMAPTALRILLRGATAEFDGKDPLKDAVVMEWLRKSFFNAAVDEWQRLRTGMVGSGGC